MNAWVFQERGRIVQFSSNYIGKLERGVFRWPSDDCRAGLRAVLGVATDAELGFRPPDRGIGAATIEADGNTPTLLLVGEEVDDVLRRTFLRNASLAGVGTALGLELTRHSLNRLMPEGAVTDIADWHDVIVQYGDIFRDSTVMLNRTYHMLLTDILGIQSALGHASNTDQRELYKIAALLSHYMAETVGDLGQRSEATRWWRTARYAADSSGDPHIMLYTRGRAAVRDIYDGRPPNLIIDAVNQTEELMAKGPVAGR
ncbi:hypothetical protein, partial [Nocardia amamiensis]|uniref:hypothetical protein n=1 Tax=Nocardia amamiensis TaxID=404578 RepID=UPI001C3FF0FD